MYSSLNAVFRKAVIADIRIQVLDRLESDSRRTGPSPGLRRCCSCCPRYALDLGDKLNLGAHVGRTVVRHYSELSYTDVKVSLNKEWFGINFGPAVVASDAKRACYQIADSGGSSAKKVGTTALVLSAGKTF